MLLNGGILEVLAVQQSALTSNMLAVTSGQNETQQFVTSDGLIVVGVVQAYGNYGSTAPIWVVQANEVWQVLGQDNIPVLLQPVLVSALVP